MSSNMNLRRLCEIRKSKGLTQDEMARKLGYKGKSGYCQLEKGKVRMSLETAQKIADILGEDVVSIFFDKQVHAEQTALKRTGTS